MGKGRSYIQTRPINYYSKLAERGNMILNIPGTKSTTSFFVNWLTVTKKQYNIFKQMPNISLKVFYLCQILIKLIENETLLSIINIHL